MDNIKFETLVGKTLSSIDNNGDSVRFVATGGESYVLLHHQDCCEHVRVEEVIGELNDLIGSPILLAEEVSNADGPAPEYPDSYTWTFYKLSTMKGDVTIRFLGESNGYYSEGVDFVKE